MTLVKRAFWLALLAGAACAAWVALQSRKSSTQPATAPLRRQADAPPSPKPSWLPPVDGQCPDGYPVKANDNSGIYHVPGGRFYERTRAERCYATPEAAEADGYRRAKA